MFRSIGHIKTMTRFLVLNLFYRSPMGTFKENYHFPRCQGDLEGGGGGGLFPIETHITCEFSGGPDPISMYLEDHIFF